MSGEETHQQASQHPHGEHFERGTWPNLAQTADDMARTAEASALVHDKMGEHRPDAADRAARDRRLAAVAAPFATTRSSLTPTRSLCSV